MGLIVTTQYAKEIITLSEIIDSETFFWWKGIYEARLNLLKLANIPGTNFGSDLLKVYFDRTWLEDIIKVSPSPEYVTFMFGYDIENGKFKGLFLVMCGMNEPEDYPSINKLYKSYQINDSPKNPIPKHELDSARNAVKNCHNLIGGKLKRFKPQNEFAGYSHPTNDIKRWLDHPEMANSNRIAAYFGVNDDRRATVMLAGSTGNFQDKIPSNPTDPSYKLFDNGTQCCPIRK